MAEPQTAETVAELGTTERAALARAALARVELRTGAAPATPRAVPVVPAVAAAPVPTALLVPPREAAPGAEVLPVLPDLSGLLPAGGLRRGSTVVVTGSASLLLALLAEASRLGAWAALVGLPDAGLLAAAQSGVVLDHLALVPDPGAAAADIIAALIDGMDVVVLGRALALSEADRRRLSARARERRCVLVSAGPWTGAQVRLTAQREGWQGLGQGEGRLRTQRLVVTRDGRGQAGQPMRASLELPGADARSGTAPGRVPGAPTRGSRSWAARRSA